MDALLYLAHRIPFPPNKGDKIRSYHFLKGLAKHFDVYLAAFIDDPNDWQYVPNLKEFCRDCFFAPLNPRKAKIGSLVGFATGEALSLPYYRNGAMAQWVDRTLSERNIHHVFAFSSPMAQFVMGSKYANLRRVMDFVDADSDKWLQYSKAKSWPASWVYRREGERLLRFERQVAMEFDASMFVSEKEADLFRSLAPEAAARVSGINNGVDTDYFSPGAHVDPFPAGALPIVFTGAMDYWANVDAVSWFAAEILPMVRQRLPCAEFYVVGSKPTKAVLDLAKLPGVVVTGAVPDVRPYLAHSAVVVAPLRIARGIQNKVLEAMAMARPTVVTPQALEGISAVVGEELLLAETPEDFGRVVANAIDGAVASTVGARARERVVASYSWATHLDKLAEIVTGASS